MAERGACNGRPRLLRSPAEQRRQRHARNRRRPGASAGRGRRDDRFVKRIAGAWASSAQTLEDRPERAQGGPRSWVSLTIAALSLARTGSGRAGAGPCSPPSARECDVRAGRLYRGRVDLPCVAQSPGTHHRTSFTGHPFAQRHEVAARGSGYGGVSAGRWALTPLATRNSAATSRVAASAPSGNT